VHTCSRCTKYGVVDSWSAECCSWLVVAGLALALRSARAVVSHRLLIGRRGHQGGLDKLVPGNPVGSKDVACRVAGPLARSPFTAEKRDRNSLIEATTLANATSLSSSSLYTALLPPPFPPFSPVRAFFFHTEIICAKLCLPRASLLF
jgi:hypothetical protein